MTGPPPVFFWAKKRPAVRNTIGFGWHPQTGELWGFDHGIDWLGDEEQREELNRLTQGAHYGWPHSYGDGKYNPHRHPAIPPTPSTSRKPRCPPSPTRPMVPRW